MKENNKFYIGWKDEIPTRHAVFLKKLLIAIFILIPMLGFIVVYFQKPFNNFNFEFGNTTTITGVYYDDPIPMLIADEGSLEGGLSRDIVLVGYGKLGAKGIIENIEATEGTLRGKKISLNGTLIYGDGKTLMELTNEENSFVEIVSNNAQRSLTKSAFKEVSLSGEIIDPKCYFGVMKPGEGKIHKSCAIRCISGGIPPVLKTKNAKGESQYYILRDQDGNPINKEVLPFVAEQISVSGKTYTVFNWNVLYVDVDDLRRM